MGGPLSLRNLGAKSLAEFLGSGTAPKLFFLLTTRLKSCPPPSSKSRLDAARASNEFSQGLLPPIMGEITTPPLTLREGDSKGAKASLAEEW